MKKHTIILLIGLIGFFSCAKLTRVGGPQNPTLKETLVAIATDMKAKLPKGSTLAVVSASRRPAVNELVEKFSIKLVEIGSPNLSVVERTNLEKAMEELKLQSSDTFDEKQSVSIGKFVGAKYVLYIDAKPVPGVVKDFNDEELNRPTPHNKVMLRAKAIEIETTRIVWAKESSFWHPMKRRLNPEERAERMRPRRRFR